MRLIREGRGLGMKKEEGLRVWLIAQDLTSMQERQRRESLDRAKCLGSRNLDMFAIGVETKATSSMTVQLMEIQSMIRRKSAGRVTQERATQNSHSSQSSTTKFGTTSSQTPSLTPQESSSSPHQS